MFLLYFLLGDLYVGRLEARARGDEIKYETNENDIIINSSEMTISNIDRDSRYVEGVKKDNQYTLYLQYDLLE